MEEKYVYVVGYNDIKKMKLGETLNVVNGCSEIVDVKISEDERYLIMRRKKSDKPSFIAHREYLMKKEVFFDADEAKTNLLNKLHLRLKHSLSQIILVRNDIEKVSNSLY